MTAAQYEHRPLHGETIPSAHVSEAQIAVEADAARRALARLGAMDLADVLGIGEPTC